MKQEEDKFTGLPENAFRELKPGEVYNPLMSPSKNYPEVNFWSVTWGIAMAILFSAAAAYLGLKVGQVFEAEDHQRHAEGHRHMDDAAQAGQTSFAVTFRAVKDIDRKRSREGRKGRSCG